MTCVHKVRWSVKRPEDCRFRLSVSHYKDRIVAPDEYSGATVVTPSDSEQVLATTDKLVREDITINPAPTEILSTDHNGTFTPSDGMVGFSQVDVNVNANPDLRPLSVAENGIYHPDGFDGYSEVAVNIPDEYLISDSVLDEDKFSGSYPSYWLRNYMPWCYPWNEDDYNLYVMTFQNNSAPQYKATLIVLNGIRHDYYVAFRAVNEKAIFLRIGTDQGNPMYATAGTRIRIYKLPPVISST
jgi:hypothetical protein